MQDEKLKQGQFENGAQLVRAVNDNPSFLDSIAEINGQPVTLYDALNRIGSDGRTPVVILEDTNGERREYSADEFLKIGHVALNPNTINDGDVANPSPTSNIEQPKQTIEGHYEKLFKPYEQNPDTDEKVPNEDDYSDLFRDNPNLDDPDKFEENSRLAVQEARIDNKNKKFINEESKKDSIQVLERAVQVDVDLNQIIKEYTQEHNITDSGELVDAIRKNKELRLKIGKHAIQKLDTFTSLYLNEVPDRIKSNQTKNPDNGPWAGQNIKSRDYVALLYLSMLDGSFSREMEQDQIDYQGGNIPKTGQHRYMARMLLGPI